MYKHRGYIRYIVPPKLGILEDLSQEPNRTQSTTTTTTTRVSVRVLLKLFCREQRYDQEIVK